MEQFLSCGGLNLCYTKAGILTIPSAEDIIQAFQDPSSIEDADVKQTIIKLYEGSTFGLDYKNPTFGGKTNHFGTWCVILANNDFYVERALDFCISPSVNNLSAAEWAYYGWIGEQKNCCDIPISERKVFDRYDQINRLNYELIHMKDRGAPIPLEYLLYILRSRSKRGKEIAESLERKVPVMFFRPIEMSDTLKKKHEALPLLNVLGYENMQIVCEIIGRVVEKTVSVEDVFSLPSSYFATEYQNSVILSTSTDKLSIL